MLSPDLFPKNCVIRGRQVSRRESGMQDIWLPLWESETEVGKYHNIRKVTQRCEVAQVINVHHRASHSECSVYTNCGVLSLRRNFPLPSISQLSGDRFHIPQNPGTFKPFAVTKKTCHL